jgi:hypothetical protein
MKHRFHTSTLRVNISLYRGNILILHQNPLNSNRCFQTRGAGKAFFWRNLYPKAKPSMLHHIVQLWSGYNAPSKTACTARCQQGWFCHMITLARILPILHVSYSYFALNVVFPSSLQLRPDSKWLHLFTHSKQFLGCICIGSDKVKMTVKRLVQWTAYIIPIKIQAPLLRDEFLSPAS